MGKTEEQSVPLLLELSTYCTLVDRFGRLKGRGKRCEIRHVSIGLAGM